MVSVCVCFHFSFVFLSIRLSDVFRQNVIFRNQFRAETTFRINVFFGIDFSLIVTAFNVVIAVVVLDDNCAVDIAAVTLNIVFGLAVVAAAIGVFFDSVGNVSGATFQRL